MLKGGGKETLSSLWWCLYAESILCQSCDEGYVSYFHLQKSGHFHFMRERE